MFLMYNKCAALAPGNQRDEVILAIFNKLPSNYMTI